MKRLEWDLHVLATKITNIFKKILLLHKIKKKKDVEAYYVEFLAIFLYSVILLSIKN